MGGVAIPALATPPKITSSKTAQNSRVKPHHLANSTKPSSPLAISLFQTWHNHPRQPAKL
jgi:hypothetical protein